MVTLFLATLAMRPAPLLEDLKRVDLAQIALSFDCPKSWIVVVNKKSEVHILFKPENAEQNAVLDIYPTNFVDEKDIWQLSQSTYVKLSKKELVRQWDEEILNVPLLLTRYNFTEKTGAAKSSVSGLIYSSAPRKLWYRLTTVPEDYDRADYAWRNALQTLKTFDNKPLTPQVPGVKPDPKAPPVDLPIKPPTITNLGDPEKGPKKPVQAKPLKTFEIVVANRKVHVKYAEDCTLEQDASGVLLIKCAALASPIRCNAFSTLDSDPADRALYKASSEALNLLAKVDRRDETGPGLNLAKADLHTIWRKGTTSTGSLTTCDASVQSGDFYMLISWRSDSATPADRTLIESILASLSIEQAP